MALISPSQRQWQYSPNAAKPALTFYLWAFLLGDTIAAGFVPGASACTLNAVDAMAGSSAVAVVVQKLSHDME